MKNSNIQIAAACVFMVVVLVILAFLTVTKSSSQPQAENCSTQNEAANTSDWILIDIETPEKVTVGTQFNIVVENLEKKPLGKDRAPFLAPPGTKNVALGKPVKSSDPFTIIGRIDYITDGNKETTDGNYVELGPGVQHVTIDLGAMYEIYAVVVWHLHKQDYVFFDVIVQTAEDENFIENVRTLFNNDIDNSAGTGIGKDKHYIETNEGKLIEARGAKARCVRLYSNGNIDNKLNYYIEVEVYGRPVE